MDIKYLYKINYESSYEDFFLNLNLSILAGEYIIEHSSFIDFIDNLSKKNINEELNSFLNVKQLYPIEYISYFEKSINIYKKFSIITNQNIKSYISKTNESSIDFGRKLSIDYDIDRFYSDVTDFQHEDSDNIKLNFLIFLLNIKISELEEYLDSSDKCLLELERYQDYLIGIYKRCDGWNSGITKILTDKISFLIYKVNYRNNKIDKNPTEDFHFKDFQIKLNSHYYKYKIYSNTSIEELEVDCFNIEKIHSINKELKKSNLINYENKQNCITDLITKIQYNLNDSINNFDKFAYISSLNLIKNTQLFLKLEKETKNNYSNLCGEDFYKKSNFDSNVFKKEIQNNFNDRYNEDYKGYEVVLNFLDEFLDNFEDVNKIFPNIYIDLLDEETSKTYITNLKNNFEELKKFYEFILKKLETSKNKHTEFDLKPIYLKFDECIIDSKITTSQSETVDIKLFLDSSYILPINYVKIEQDYLTIKNSYKFRINQIKEKIEVLINYNLSKKTREDFEKRVKDNEFKLVQIVAMFVSIATFVLINVKIFDDKTGSESFGILLSLAGVFMLFNSFFKWIIKDQLYDNKKILCDYFLWLPIILIFIGSVFIFNTEGKSIILKIEEDFYKKTDSLINIKSNEFDYKIIKDSLNKHYENRQIIECIEKLEKK